MNKVILCGRLTKDIEVKEVRETQMAKFSLAVDRKYKKGEERTADFINCIAFGGLAKFASDHFKKGDAMTLEGKIQTGNYKNKDNQTVYTTDVVADNIEFPIGGNKKNNGNDTSSTSKATSNDGFMNVPDNGLDELPFE